MRNKLHICVGLSASGAIHNSTIAPEVLKPI